MQEILFHNHPFGTVFRLDWKTYHYIKRTSSTMRGLGFYHIGNLTSQSDSCFIDTGRKHTISGSEAKDFITHGKNDNQSGSLSFLGFLPRSTQRGQGHGDISSWDAFPCSEVHCKGGALSLGDIAKQKKAYTLNHNNPSFILTCFWQNSIFY